MYVRPWLSRASEGRFSAEGSLVTATLPENGASVGSGPGPAVVDDVSVIDPRAVSVTVPPRWSRYWEGIWSPVNIGGLAPVGAEPPGEPAAAGAAADRASKTANASTAKTKPIAIPPKPPLVEGIQTSSWEKTGTRPPPILSVSKRFTLFKHFPATWFSCRSIATASG